MKIVIGPFNVVFEALHGDGWSELLGGWIPERPISSQVSSLCMSPQIKLKVELHLITLAFPNEMLHFGDIASHKIEVDVGWHASGLTRFAAFQNILEFTGFGDQLAARVGGGLQGAVGVVVCSQVFVR